MEGLYQVQGNRSPNTFDAANHPGIPLTSISHSIQSWRPHVVVLAILLVAGCDSAAIEPSQDQMLASSSIRGVEICHVVEDGSFKKITVAQSAVNPHLRHGDGVPAGAVRGLPGRVFDADCQPVEVIVVTESVCPCFSAEDLAAQGEIEVFSGVAQCGDPFPGPLNRDLAAIVFTNGYQFCSGFGCFTSGSAMEKRSCARNSSGFPEDTEAFAGDLTPEVDAACRTLIVDMCPVFRTSATTDPVASKTSGSTRMLFGHQVEMGQ